jgi:predicted nuclease with RNAse H fold
LHSVAQVVDCLLARHRPRVIGIDSPFCAAQPGQRSRQGERDLYRAEICHIRYTPDKQTIEARDAYYEWIRNGLALYSALATQSSLTRAEVIEVFPTASWTRWHGPRSGRPRARWSREALEAWNLDGLPSRRLNQDQRDALGAALTARAYALHRVQRFGEIVVPVGR